MLLEKCYSFAVVICSVKKSRAEGKDAGTFLCAAFQYEPHQSAPVYFTEAETTLDSLKNSRGARRATAGMEYF